MDHSETDIPAEVAANTPSTDGPSSSAVAASPSASSPVGADQVLPASDDQSLDDASTSGGPSSSTAPRRRGSRGGQGRRGAARSGEPQDDDDALSAAQSSDDDDRNDVELPEPMSEGRASPEAAEKALVRKPRIGDTMPIPTSPPPGPARASDRAEMAATSPAATSGVAAVAVADPVRRPATAPRQSRVPRLAAIRVGPRPARRRVAGREGAARDAPMTGNSMMRCSNSVVVASATASRSAGTSWRCRCAPAWRRWASSKAAT